MRDWAAARNVLWNHIAELILSGQRQGTVAYTMDPADIWLSPVQLALLPLFTSGSPCYCLYLPPLPKRFLQFCLIHITSYRCSPCRCVCTAELGSLPTSNLEKGWEGQNPALSAFLVGPIRWTILQIEDSRSRVVRRPLRWLGLKGNPRKQCDDYECNSHLSWRLPKFECLKVCFEPQKV